MNEWAKYVTRTQDTRNARQPPIRRRCINVDIKEYGGTDTADSRQDTAAGPCDRGKELSVKFVNYET